MTVTPVANVRPFSDAVIDAVPCVVAAVAMPEALTATIAESDAPHVTADVRSCVLPSE